MAPITDSALRIGAIIRVSHRMPADLWIVGRHHRADVVADVTAFTVLLEAEVNAEREHQTARHTTVGLPEPSGARGATHADEVAPD